MKKTIKLAVVAALALGATSAFATNGSTLIGMGAKSRGMAGTSIGISHGAESALSNPAMITGIKKDHEISFGGTLFMPSVSADMGAGASDSAADMNVIPEVSLATKVNDNFYWGIGMWGTAGMGVDYRDATPAQKSNFKMVTNLQLMQFGVPLAYTTSGFTVAVAPILQYGALDINYAGQLDTSNTAFPSPQTIASGAGVAQDLQFGYSLGLSYEVSDFTVGAVYKSQIDMEYKGMLSVVTQPFANFGMFGGQPLSDKLSTPAEMGVGISYAMGEHTIALDYKQIKWSSAKGYKEFGWDDQNVIALGYEYAAKNWALRVGYNYASNPVKEQASGAGTADVTGSAINMFNALGFPAIVESHYAIGGSYAISDVTSIDAAFTYAPESTQTYDISGFQNFGPTNPASVEVKHSQTALSVQLTYAF